MMAWALFCHDFDLSKGINILSEKCPVVLDHYSKAYSEQGTLLDIPQNFCRKWLRDGRFNPYREPNRQLEQPKQQQQQTQAQTQSNSILALSDSTKHDEMRPYTHLDAQ